MKYLVESQSGSCCLLSGYLTTGFPGQPDLQAPLNALNESKEERKYENRNRNPESIPLHRVTPVIPPLS